MKKPTEKQKRYSHLYQLKIATQEQKKAKHKKHRKLILKRSVRLCVQNRTIKISAPEEFGLTNEESRETLLDFLTKMSSHLSSGHKVHISFSDTHTLLPCGMLWATAKIESLLNLYPNKITCTYPTNNIVEQLFQHIGLLEKLGNHKSRTEINADSVKYWHYISGKSTDDVGQFKALFQAISLKEETKSGLFDSMSEAVTNTIHHAYRKGKNKEWWMFAQHTNNTLTVAICDLGIGIPNSLREKPELKEWLSSPVNAVRKRKDTALIEIAVESSRTKTKLPHRGKGLKDMLDFVKNGTVGGFRIYSKNGSYDYNATMNREIGKDYKSAINGTIIQWQLSLESDP